MSDIKTLKSKRSSIKGRLTKFRSYLELVKSVPNLTSTQVNELTIKLDKIKLLSTEFDTLQDDIEAALGQDIDLIKELDERDETESSFTNAIAVAQTILENNLQDKGIPTSANSCSSQSHHSHPSYNSNPVGFKLPTIQVGKFDGTYSKWLEFRDMYKSLIHDNDVLMPIHKFHYLNSYLEGEAKRVILNLEVSSVNYLKAWDILCKRYDNKKQLINNHLNALLNVEHINRESEGSLRSLVDHTRKNLRALASLGQPTENWDTIIIHIIAQKLENSTSLRWEEYKSSLEEMPTLEQFNQFLQKRADVLETHNQNKAEKFKNKPSYSSNGYKPLEKLHSKSFSCTTQEDSTPASTHFQIKCHYCKGGHTIYNCQSFLSKTPSERSSEAAKLMLCINCLRSGHNVKKCRMGPCRICRKRHNSLLHSKPCSKPAMPSVSSQPAVTSTVDTGAEPLQNPVQIAVNFTAQPVNHVMLSTAMIQVTNPSTGSTEAVRALLDCGSQASFMTTDLKRRLGLQSVPTEITKIVGIGNTSCKHVSERCVMFVKSLHSNFNATMTCSVLPELTGNIPKTRIDLKHFNIPPHIMPLADPKFNESGPIDLLIGADLFWQIIGPDQIPLGDNRPYLISSKLGWLISGPILIKHGPRARDIQCNFTMNEFEKPDPLDSISRFWELEEVPNKKPLLSDSEKECEELFKAHTTRLDSGRFCVRLPLKDTPDCLGDSYYVAKGQFLSLEKRLRKQPELKKDYSNFISEYTNLGHCSESPIPRPDLAYFLCHHAVMREHSESTKIRVVFNGSQPTASGFSANDLHLVGPIVQESLFAILLRFRQYKFVLTGDIEKMYRQVLVHEDDRNLQLILWREDESQPIKTLRLNTVTYGLASSSYLSTRCLFQLGEECGDEPIKTIIQRDFYCDDLLTGSDSEPELVKILNSVTAAMQSACFNLRKFRSNSPTIFQSSNVNLQDELSLSDSSSALGLGWDPKSDKFQFTIDIPSNDEVTKRNILASSCKIFDPLGLLCPSTIQAKMLMQQLWLHKLDWDEAVPNDLKKKWLQIKSGLLSLATLQLPRRVLCDDPKSIEMHSFCDSSMLAYGACIYLRSIDSQGNILVKLLCAKSRVAPTKPALTIPRLELLGALLASNLCKSVLEALRCPISRCVHWSDSSVVLAYLNSSPSRLKSFIGNKVVEICENTNKSDWRHVPTTSNPADYISRSVSAEKMPTLDMWWSGPSFLSQDEAHWPTSPARKDDPEAISLIVPSEAEPIIQFDKYSSLNRAKRVFAWIFRFANNTRYPSPRIKGPLGADELERSFSLLAKQAQIDSFQKEYNTLSKGQCIAPKSKILSLSPFLDKENVMRVGGRLERSDYDFNKKHPIILSSSHYLTKLIFQHEHLRHLHAGPQLLLGTIRESIWPVTGRKLARSTVRNCVVCKRHQGQTLSPMMGDLPPERITPAFPFQSIGMDMAGPFNIINKKGRGARTSKCYLCLFICFRYKCVHLEAVSDLSKEAFLSCLRRFISRRGKPYEIFSDNGRNFVGAAKELGRFLLSNVDSITEYAATEQIKFNFHPAYAPHFSGLAEAGIKSAKHHVKRVLGNANLTFEELSTLFTQVEAVLNSRPLYPLSSCPQDFLALTPGHFLIGRPLTALPTPDRTAHTARYEVLEKLRKSFCTRWQRDYINELQQRTKWKSNNEKLKLGDLVIIQEDNIPPLCWKMGRVTKLYPGHDGTSRVADIATARSTVRRALTRLCPLLPYEAGPGGCLRHDA